MPTLVSKGQHVFGGPLLEGSLFSDTGKSSSSEMPHHLWVTRFFN